jgi:hypothetical protein
MKNTILAATAALALALSVGAGFAAERSTDNNSSSGVQNQCDSILASKEGHSSADVRYCENHR